MRSTTILERSLEEARRRTRVIGRFPGEAHYLSLRRSVLDVAISGAKGLGFAGLDRQRLTDLSPVVQRASQVA